MIRTTQAHTSDMGRIVLPYLRDWHWRASADRQLYISASARRGSGLCTSYSDTHASGTMSLIITAETCNGGVWHPTLLKAQINKEADKARDARTSAAIVQCIIPGVNSHDAMPSWGAVKANPTWSPQARPFIHSSTSATLSYAISNLFIDPQNILTP